MEVSRTTCVGLLLLFVLVLGGGVVGVASADDATDPSAERSAAFAADAGPIAASNVTAQSDTIQTDHFEITYESGQRSEAEELAEYADEYYELLFQRFGVAPADSRVNVRIVDGDPSECDGDGCYQSGLIVLSSSDRGLFYHELTHHLQDQTFGVGGSSLTPEVSVEGTARHLEAPPEEIATRASFDRDDVYFHSEDAAADEYDTLALFPEYVLHEYGREGYDVLFTEDHPRELESVTGDEYSAIIDDFYAQLDAQESRMRDGGAPAPGFTYDPFLVERGEEVTFDARTPEAIEAIDRSWYDGEVEAYEWDFDGDGEIDATGPTVTRTIDDPVDKTVTLYVTIDGERYEASQTLLPAVSPEYGIESVEEGPGTFEYTGIDSWGEVAATQGQNFTLDTTIDNSGGVGGAETAELLFRGEVVDTTTVSVASGDSRTVTLSHDLPDDIEPGNHRYQVRVGDSTSREKPVYVVEKAVVEVAPHGGMSVGADDRGGLTVELPADDETTVHVPVKITEPGDLSLSTEMELYLDGELIDETGVAATSGRDTADFEMDLPDEPGEYELRAVLPNEQGVLSGTTEVSKTLEVEGDEREDTGTIGDESLSAACGPDLEESCQISVEPDDPPETVTVGEPVSFDVVVQREEARAETIALEVDVGDSGSTTQRQTRSDGSVQLTVSEVFEEPGEYDVSVEGKHVHTIAVREEGASDESSDGDRENDQSSNEESTENGSGSGTEDGSEGRDDDADDGDGATDSDSSTPGFGLVAAAFSIALSLVGARRLL